MTITVEIEHTMAEGTLLTIHGGRIPDEVIRPLTRQPYCWNYSRSLGAYYQQSSRDQLPRRGRINATKAHLEDAGYEATITVDTTPRPMAESETDRANRIEQYADRLTERAEKKATEADGHQTKADQYFDQRPMGQPFLTDHYSYNRDVKQYNRAMGHDEKARDLHGYARILNARAEIAANHNDQRYAPRTVRSRVRTLEKDLHGVNTRLTKGAYMGPGHYEPYSPASLERFEEKKGHIEHHLAYWRLIMQEHVQSGELSNFTKDDFTKGKTYLVKKGERNEWYKVVRVNAKTVTVETFVNADGETWQHGKLPYDDITEIQELTGTGGN